MWISPGAACRDEKRDYCKVYCMGIQNTNHLDDPVHSVLPAHRRAGNGCYHLCRRDIDNHVPYTTETGAAPT